MSTLKNPTVAIVALVLFVNALSYATIIPLMYPYAARFGIDAVGLSLLFVSFSIAQFLATPIIGRLSDKYGRKPLLLISLLGTSLSLALFASAQSVFMLFFARVLDGITGGNISVAQAMVADSTEGPERAKGFGVIWGAFGGGFVFGPALAAILSTYDLTIPFWFASALALFGTIVGWIVLKETLPTVDKKKVTREPFINLPAIGKAIFSPVSGLVLFLTFISAMAINTFFIGFQTYTNDVLRLPANQIGIIFALFGLINVFMQMVGLQWFLKKIPSKKNIILISFVMCALFLGLSGFATSVVLFTVLMMGLAMFFAPQNPLISGLLSERTNPEDQGGMMGINQSYMSLGQIAGPLVAGLVVSRVSVSAIFFAAALLFVVAIIAARGLYQPVKQKANI